jgi:hypothetical protein
MMAIVEDEPASSRTGKVLWKVDAFALLAFVIVGIRSHYESGAAATFLRNAVPLLVAWFGAAVVVGTYRRPSTRTLLITWVLAVPVGLVVRSLIIGSPTGSRLVTFLGVGLAFTLLFLLIGRLLARVIGRRVLPVGPRT